jgi:hypothetical protein
MKSASVIEDGRWCQSKSMRNVNHIHCESEMTSTILIASLPESLSHGMPVESHLYHTCGPSITVPSNEITRV